MRQPDLSRRAASEGVGTALLLGTVVGSGVMAERLAGGNAAIALLANSIATGTGLIALILAFGSISGAHFNPVVTVAQAARGSLAWKEVPHYVFAQVVGAVIGVGLAHLMFGLPVLSLSGHVRTGGGQWLAEAVATFGLLLVLWGCTDRGGALAPFAVGGYITAAYWFTSSTSFANPAVTMARSLTDTFSGIRPADAPGFVVAELLGACVALAFWRWLGGRVPGSQSS